MSISNFWKILKNSGTQYLADQVPRLGAAIAYYTVFSIVPLLTVTITLVGLIFGTEAVQSHILAQMSALLGTKGTDAIKDMLEQAARPQTGLQAGTIALLTLLAGATGLFGEIQGSLNTIWRITSTQATGIWGILRSRLLSLLALLGTAFLLIVSLVFSAVLAALSTWYSRWLPVSGFVLPVLDLAISLMLLTGLFAMMFKILPDVEIKWQDVWPGAALSAVLFTVGKYAIGIYIVTTELASAYGAAGSLVILLTWVYYSSQIFLFGAEFTKAQADLHSPRSSALTDPALVSPLGDKLANSVLHKQHRRGMLPVPRSRLLTSLVAIGVALLVNHLFPERRQPPSDP